MPRRCLHNGGRRILLGNAWQHKRVFWKSHNAKVQIKAQQRRCPHKEGASLNFDALVKHSQTCEKRLANNWTKNQDSALHNISRECEASTSPCFTQSDQRAAKQTAFTQYKTKVASLLLILTIVQQPLNNCSAIAQRPCPRPMLLPLTIAQQLLNHRLTTVNQPLSWLIQA